MSTRPARVGSAFAWEVAKHTTERDREIAWLLYRQKILTTDQLRLLFFGSLRRCQDRLLWLYRHRVIDRFYPAGPFSLGKPQAHWLLDEVGALLVAARLGRAARVLTGIASKTSTNTCSSLTDWSATDSHAASSPRPLTRPTCGSGRGSRAGARSSRTGHGRRMKARARMPASR